MARFAPFETRPQLAVAVSGGSDSLALTVLLHRWLARRDGRLTALTVDHGLRPESAREAAWVGRQLRRQGIAHRTLRWDAGKPAANLQARAREARYALLADWCRRRGVLHLAVAHHLDDQAETLLLRLGRGSGLHGLSGMTAIAHLRDVRVIRPLLDCPRARLAATLQAMGASWIEDPSNDDLAFARTRMRGLMPGLAREGLDAARLGTTVAHLARARAAIDAATARLLAEAVMLHPLGFAWLDWGTAAKAPEEVRLRALGALLTTLSGEAYAPRFERLERLHQRLIEGLDKGITLGGCVIAPLRRSLVIAREPKRCATAPLGPDRRHWDGRFEIEIAPKARDSARKSLCGLSIGPLGARGLAEVRREQRDRGIADAAAGTARPPLQALRALPAIRRGEALLAAPHLGFWRDPALRNATRSCRFAPKNPLTQAWFTVA